MFFSIFHDYFYRIEKLVNYNYFIKKYKYLFLNIYNIYH